MDFSKTFRELRIMAAQLPEKRFNRLVALLWGCIGVAGIFALAHLSATLPWERLLP